ncbi:purine-cytosine permease family protein [Actinomadura chibensis]|uniref:Allantoin permease n=1 Tax=Actinomadura chibensis TaxID=392828 RepID=A0A5D0N6Q7_9ACTN|nr:cytosine permease [Actinomadura chibensis]TYB40124.1 hypothetical protein FXF69_39740 [Actinomadura chibensis]
METASRSGPPSAPTAEWSESREDFALRYVPVGFRHWSVLSLFGVMLGITTALFFLAWGGVLVQTYGTRDLVVGMVVASAILGAISYLWADLASRTGLNSDLLSRGAGFGFMGSAFTSIIYTFNFLLFFAVEGAIMANAVMARWPQIPSAAVYSVTGLVCIPLTWYGLRLMNILMWVTLPVIVVFLGLTVWEAAQRPMTVDFWGYEPSSPVAAAAGPPILQLMATALALSSTVPVATDMARFIPPHRRRIGAFLVGPVFVAMTLLVPVLLGAWLSLRFGETDPGRYLPSVFGVWGVLFVVATQLRINTSNVYSGSLAYSNFFCRAFHFTPGRHWWVVLTVVLGTALMFGDVYSHLNDALTFEGVFIIAWVMAVVADMTVNKKLLKLSPEDFPYKRAHTSAFNPVGVVPVVFALLAALPLAFGLAGDYGKTLAPFLAGGLSFVLVPVVALVTRGRHYIVPSVAVNADPALVPIGSAAAGTAEPSDEERECVRCADRFELAEFVTCPFHEGLICSVCCASDGACKELCKSPRLLQIQSTAAMTSTSKTKES